MHLVQRDCVVCPSRIPDHCEPACGENEVCSIAFQTCSSCSVAVCIPSGTDSTSSSSNGGPNIGAIVGGIAGGVVIVLLIIGFRWYRSRQALANAARQRATFEPKPDVVASADTVLNRPDPTINIVVEKAPSAVESRHTFEDGSPVRFEPPENPFSDHASIATASDRATNAIPIGLLTPSSASLASKTAGLGSAAMSTNGATSIASSIPSGLTLHPPSESPRSFTFAQQQSPSNVPMRPQRGPEIDMRLDLNRPMSTTSEGTLLPPKAPYAASARTGLSTRSSVLSTSSSFLNEAPQIVTPKQASFRQVLGVQRAAVVQLGSPLSGTPSASPRVSTSTTGRSLTSLAEGSDPFNDADDAETAESVSYHNDGRPISTMSTVESIANITSAQRVQFLRPLNLADPSVRPSEGRPLLPPSPLSSSSSTYSPTITGRSPVASNASTPAATPRAIDFRTAGQLTPPSQAVPKSFDDMLGQGPPSFDDMGRPSSLHSFAGTNRTSTADSILESFPFVPPSPISLHHAQLQPSQMQQQQQQQSVQGPIQGRTVAVRGPSSLRTESTQDLVRGNENKVGRMTLGLSTVSSASSGLGGFPFQFEGGDGQRTHASTIGPSPLRQPHTGEEDAEDGGAGLENTIEHGDRASLDTLQLSRDLSEFPLPMVNSGLGGPRP